VAGEGEAVPAEAVECALVVPVVRHAPRVPPPAVSQAQVRAWAVAGVGSGRVLRRLALRLAAEQRLLSPLEQS